MMRDAELAKYAKILQSLPPDAHVVEYGCGGSTVWLSERLQPPQRLDSIEHNLDWFMRVHDVVKHVPFITMHLHSPMLPLERYRFAQPEEEMPAGLTQYLNPGVNWSDVSLVTVDGVARSAVLARLPYFLKSGTTVLLHDYADRELWYDWAIVGPRYIRVSLTQTLLELRIT